MSGRIESAELGWQQGLRVSRACSWEEVSEAKVQGAGGNRRVSQVS